jgi:outer membrane receptor protein involved in Fe transport
VAGGRRLRLPECVHQQRYDCGSKGRARSYGPAEHLFALEQLSGHQTVRIRLGLVNRDDMFAAIDNTVVLPGYIRADAAVYFTFNEKFRLQSNLTNLFNKKYYVICGWQ